MLVKILIEPYAVDQIDPVRGDRNVVNNWNIASMNMAAMDALRGSRTDGDDDVAHHKDATGGRAADRDGKDSGFSEGWCKESPQHPSLEPCRHAGQSALSSMSATPDEPHATWGTQRAALAEGTFILDTWPLIGSRSSDCSFDGAHQHAGLHLIVMYTDDKCVMGVLLYRICFKYRRALQRGLPPLQGRGATRVFVLRRDPALRSL